MNTSFYTLGCKLNQCESEALASSFKSRGFFIQPSGGRADIFVVNTCTVTSKAEQKARRMIRKFSRENPDSPVFVTGCYAQLNNEDLASLAENVFVIPLDLKHTIMDLPEILQDAVHRGMTLMEAAALFVKGESEVLSPSDRFRFIGSTHTVHTRAYLKIQDGCNNNCAYCRVRIARGRSVSLALDEAVRRAADLETEGYREIILTGVNISDYSDPVVPERDLSSLLNALTGTLKKARIRLSSLEPDRIDSSLAAAAAHQLVVPHFHIPVQSGSDTVLRKINRNYTSARVKAAVELLRSVKDDPFIAADIIVGLPYETDDDFDATYSLIEESEFSQVHIFPYSPRPGTELYTVPVHVPERVAKERAGRMRDLAFSLFREYTGRWKGREVEVILEEKRESDSGVKWYGLSGNYLHTSVTGIPAEGAEKGSLVLAEIQSVEKGIVSGFVKFL